MKTLIVALACLFAGGASAADGAALFAQHCAACHGVNREGATGPKLLGAWDKVKPTVASVSAFIAEGNPLANMPSWKHTLSAGEINAVATFLLAPRAPAPAATTAPAAATFAPTTAAGLTTTTAGAAVPAAPPATSHAYPELANFKLPVGFSIAVYSDQVEAARSLAVAPSGVVFVGSLKAGKVYALISTKNNGVADKVVTVASGLNHPIGVTYLNGALYVAEISRVLRFADIDKTFEHNPAYTVVKGDFPTDKWHGEKVIKAGPDGKLYVPIGAPCNVCNKEDALYSKIYRMDPDGSHFEEVARGVRNSVGISWHPLTKQMWFTDNGRDEMGDNLPSDKLNLVTKTGQHFGFPYCAGGVVPDPEFAAGRRCGEFVAPMAKLGPHVAALGLAFNTGDHFPAAYRNQLFVAEHGSWNRSQKIGYRVALITLADNQVATDTVFIDGFLQNGVVVGRPVDVAFLADGSMLVSDDFKGRVYRVSYAAK